ncbi:hypothetical protein FSP39_005583 [Pinctada imbricata]|uniref:Uncharacterized protein n=1 Tax=Pinctada imbricata TaxID=66713 RepID=A0AA88YMW5_PINIB|nr:hypothetical protein FSP39_005583 [Pinctada imbricata]
MDHADATFLGILNLILATFTTAVNATCKVCTAVGEQARCPAIRQGNCLFANNIDSVGVDFTVRLQMIDCPKMSPPEFYLNGNLLTNRIRFTTLDGTRCIMTNPMTTTRGTFTSVNSIQPDSTTVSEEDTNTALSSIPTGRTTKTVDKNSDPTVLGLTLETIKPRTTTRTLNTALNPTTTTGSKITAPTSVIPTTRDLNTAPNPTTGSKITAPTSVIPKTRDLNTAPNPTTGSKITVPTSVVPDGTTSTTVRDTNKVPSAVLSSDLGLTLGLSVFVLVLIVIIAIMIYHHRLRPRAQTNTAEIPLRFLTPPTSPPPMSISSSCPILSSPDPTPSSPVAHHTRSKTRRALEL